MRIALALLLAASALAQPSQNYSFSVRVMAAGPAQRQAAHLTVRAPDGSTFTAMTDLGTTPDEQIVTLERGGRTYRIVLRPTGDGMGTAELEVRENGAVVANSRAEFAPAVLRRSLDPRFPALDGTIQPPVVVERVEPMYPAEARAARISGIVIVEAKIDEFGSVVDVNVLKPLPFGLDQAAVDAVRQWKFRPAMKDGKATPVTFNLTVNFKLAGVPPIE